MGPRSEPGVANGDEWNLSKDFKGNATRPGGPRGSLEGGAYNLSARVRGG